MTCIKTGARVYFDNYGCTLAADIYEVGSAIVVRTSEKRDDGGEFVYGVRGSEGATHKLTSSGRQEFWRTDLGVFVVARENLTEMK